MDELGVPRKNCQEQSCKQDPIVVREIERQIKVIRGNCSESKETHERGEKVATRKRQGDKEREREATLRPGDLAKGKMRKVAREEGPK